MKRKPIIAPRQQTAKFATARRRLTLEIIRRRTAEESLKNSKRHYGQLLEQSRQMQEQMRSLSHQILLAQEEERKQISRELHDDIAQTLAGINVYLSALKAESAISASHLGRHITRTQRLVEKSVDIVHRFARELRPTVLDDLGLIPALHSFMKAFTKRTQVQIRFTAFAGVEELDMARRTMLFRVAQEALTNIARHAQAGQVQVSLRKTGSTIVLEIQDDGRSFQVERVQLARRNKRLGLVGMRERVEIVGGTLQIESAPGKGTTVRATIPFIGRTSGRSTISKHL